MPYKPEPVDTSLISLAPEILALTERLAKNAHDVWARQRLGDGWVWGPNRDDDAKQHPSLVEYSALSEAEREYDRKIALETLRTVMAFGYRIVKA